MANYNRAAAPYSKPFDRTVHFTPAELDTLEERSRTISRMDWTDKVKLIQGNRRALELEAMLHARDTLTCTWTAEEKGDTTFETGCGESFQFFDDGPEENSFNFCHACGRKVVVAYTYTEPEETTAE